jgi:hypothetical protein
MVLIPLTLGIHFSPTNNLAISTMFFAPTGAYNLGNLSNPGLGYWTFKPNIAHTYLWQQHGLELDNFVSFDIHLENPTTHYESGTLFHWDGMLLKYFAKNRLALGGIVSNVTQFTDDRGKLATLLHGFQGQAWGAGPIAMYIAKKANPGVVIQLRWVPEFAVTNLMKGNTLLLGVSLKFN